MMRSLLLLVLSIPLAGLAIAEEPKAKVNDEAAVTGCDRRLVYRV